MLRWKCQLSLTPIMIHDNVNRRERECKSVFAADWDRVIVNRTRSIYDYSNRISVLEPNPYQTVRFGTYWTRFNQPLHKLMVIHYRLKYRTNLSRPYLFSCFHSITKTNSSVFHVFFCKKHLVVTFIQPYKKVGPRVSRCVYSVEKTKLKPTVKSGTKQCH